MTVSKVKRSQVMTFLNTGTLLSPVWSLIGDGVKAGKIAYNPKVTEETYINADSATISVDGYAPKMPIEQIAMAGDAVFAYLDALRKDRGILSDAETQIVNVWAYEDSALGYYPAEYQPVSIAIDDFGGDGGSAAKLNYTINYLGDPTRGTFSPAALAFVSDPVLAILTTMAIGSVTLAPLFSANHSWLWYAGSVAASSVTMTSTLSGATILQKVGVTTVNQGAAASLSMGVNHLTIQVTVGTEVVTYHIDITRTA